MQGNENFMKNAIIIVSGLERTSKFYLEKYLTNNAFFSLEGVSVFLLYSSFTKYAFFQNKIYYSYLHMYD